MRKCVLAMLGLLVISTPALAGLSGAIFTTTANGLEVNANIYSSKDQVYLDGGPGPHAPAGAAGLPDGTYVFQVTDPSGKTLLSTDPAVCRQFTVSGGLITGVVPAGGCEHMTATDLSHNSFTVQLIPYLDTPNNGGEYKAWATPVADYIAGCDILGVAAGQELSTVDCGQTGGLYHGFIPKFSKTDNFKVNLNNVHKEIDTHFNGPNFTLIIGMLETWTDTLGVDNPRFSENDANAGIQGIAHIEDVETGIHNITITNQPGCTVSGITVSEFIGNKFLNQKSVVIATYSGPATVPITVKSNFTGTIYIDVSCN